ncbi:MAG: Lrp/AsnC ligand binding domain-containing protein [Nitrososphaeraceae archaeon]
MPTAYVFMNCNSGAEERIIQEIADLSEIKEVRGIYGMYDIFVKVESKTTESLNDIIKFGLRIKPDVTSAMALFVNSMQPGKG